MIDDLKKI